MAQEDDAALLAMLIARGPGPHVSLSRFLDDDGDATGDAGNRDDGVERDSRDRDDATLLTILANAPAAPHVGQFRFLDGDNGDNGDNDGDGDDDDVNESGRSNGDPDDNTKTPGAAHVCCGCK